MKGERLRVGRRVGRTIYVQLGPQPSDSDPLIGVMDTPALAAAVVAAVNASVDDEPDYWSWEQFRALVHEAFLLRQYGERALGGKETWRDWEVRAETLLRQTVALGVPCRTWGRTGPRDPEGCK